MSSRCIWERRFFALFQAVHQLLYLGSLGRIVRIGEIRAILNSVSGDRSFRESLPDHVRGNDRNIVEQWSPSVPLLQHPAVARPDMSPDLLDEILPLVAGDAESDAADDWR